MHMHRLSTALAVVSSATLALTQECPPGYARPGGITWVKCDSATNETLQCATLEVPMDWTNPTAGEKLNLRLVRLPAAADTPNPKSIIVNPGGPGSSGIKDLIGSKGGYQAIFGDSFHIISFDPRGVGLTTPYMCPKAAEIGGSYHTDEGLADTFAYNKNQSDLCAGAEYTTLIGTAFVARDINAIAEAIGEDGLIRYLGYSYGTLLGATVAAMFPDKVDKVILDGNINPNDYYRGLGQEGSTDFDRAVARYFELCATANPANCAVSEAGKTGQQLLDTFDAFLLKIGYDQGKLVRDVFQPVLYDPSSYKAFAANLSRFYKDPRTINPAPVQRRQLDWTPYYVENKTDIPLVGITCGDVVERQMGSEANFKSWLAIYEKTSKYGGDIAINILYSCSVWAYDAKEKFTGPFSNIRTKNPILFVNTQYDPVTPLISAQNSAKGFVGARVLASSGVGHCSNSNRSPELDEQIKNYMVNGTFPSEDIIYTPEIANVFDNIPDRKVDGPIIVNRNFDYPAFFKNEPVIVKRQDNIPDGCTQISASSSPAASSSPVASSTIVISSTPAASSASDVTSIASSVPAESSSMSMESSVPGSSSESIESSILDVSSTPAASTTPDASLTPVTSAISDASSTALASTSASLAVSESFSDIGSASASMSPSESASSSLVSFTFDPLQTGVSTSSEVTSSASMHDGLSSMLESSSDSSSSATSSSTGISAPTGIADPIGASTSDVSSSVSSIRSIVGPGVMTTSVPYKATSVYAVISASSKTLKFRPSHTSYPVYYGHSYGSHGPSSSATYGSYDDSYENSYDDSYENSYENSYDDSYEDSHEDSYEDSYDSSYEDNYEGSYEDSYEGFTQSSRTPSPSPAWAYQPGHVPITKTYTEVAVQTITKCDGDGKYCPLNLATPTAYVTDVKTGITVVAVPTKIIYATRIIDVCSTGLTTSSVTVTQTCKDGCTAKPTGIPHGYTTTVKYCEACATPSTVTVTICTACAYVAAKPSQPGQPLVYPAQASSVPNYTPQAEPIPGAPAMPNNPKPVVDAPPKPVDAPSKPAEGLPKPVDAPSKPADAPSKPADAPSKPADAPAKPSQLSVAGGYNATIINSQPVPLVPGAASINGSACSGDNCGPAPTSSKPAQLTWNPSTGVYGCSGSNCGAAPTSPKPAQYTGAAMRKNVEVFFIAPIVFAAYLL